MLSSKALKDLFAEARPIIERQLDDAELIAGLREVVTAQGGDWSSLKALLKAQIQDERDEAGEGKRVRKILDKADYSAAYADLLGLKMNENNFSADEFDPETGEVIDTTGTPETADGFPVGVGADLPAVEPGANASKGVTGGESAASNSEQVAASSTALEAGPVASGSV